MRTKTKVWLIIATFLVLIGSGIFISVMTTLKWDFTKLETVKYETNIYEISETFDNLSINTDTADIDFAISDDGKCSVECQEQENASHSVEVKDGTLSIELVDKRTVNNFIGYIGLNFSAPKITICLPQSEYKSLVINEDTGNVKTPDDFTFLDVDVSLNTGDVDFSASVSKMLKIKTSTGNIRVENISVGVLDLSVSTGKVTVANVTCESDVKVGVSTGEAYLTNTKCKNVLSSGDTGDIFLDNVIATKKFSVERSTGDVKFNRSDAAEIYIKTDTGDVKGSLLTDKVFVAQTDTGKIVVPKTVNGGKCEITTDTGDIAISICD